jgi:hypothetical protein
MAEVTVNRLRSLVSSDRRRILADVDIAADGDTLTVGNTMHKIEAVSAKSPTNNAIGVTTSEGPAAQVTFQTGGAEAGVLVEVLGQ